MGSGKWEVVGGKWEVGCGKWDVGSGKSETYPASLASRAPQIKAFRLSGVWRLGFGSQLGARGSQLIPSSVFRLPPSAFHLPSCVLRLVFVTPLKRTRNISPPLSPVN